MGDMGRLDATMGTTMYATISEQRRPSKRRIDDFRRGNLSTMYRFRCDQLGDFEECRPLLWDVDNLCLSGFVFDGCKTGSAAPFVSSHL